MKNSSFLASVITGLSLLTAEASLANIAAGLPVACQVKCSQSTLYARYENGVGSGTLNRVGPVELNLLDDDRPSIPVEVCKDLKRDECWTILHSYSSVWQFGRSGCAVYLVDVDSNLNYIEQQVSDSLVLGDVDPPTSVALALVRPLPIAIYKGKKEQIAASLSNVGVLRSKSGKSLVKLRNQGICK